MRDILGGGFRRALLAPLLFIVLAGAGWGENQQRKPNIHQGVSQSIPYRGETLWRLLQAELDLSDTQAAVLADFRDADMEVARISWSMRPWQHTEQKKAAEKARTETLERVYSTLTAQQLSELLTWVSERELLTYLEWDIANAKSTNPQEQRLEDALSARGSYRHRHKIIEKLMPKNYPSRDIKKRIYRARLAVSLLGDYVPSNASLLDQHIQDVKRARAELRRKSGKAQP